MHDIIPHHLLTTNVDDFPAACQPHRAELEGRTMLVKKSLPAPVECIVRGYLVGSGSRFSADRNRMRIPLPEGLVEASRLDQPIFTPSTKAPVGAHDVNITFDEMIGKVGKKRAEAMREATIAIYTRAREIAEKKGIMIADTKLEFGIEGDNIILIDEVLTPDSSRFWPADGYQPGKTPESFDKQFVRDYLFNLPWDMKSPPPILPQEIVRKTQEKYTEALKRLTIIKEFIRWQTDGNQGASRGKRGHPNLKDAFRPGAVGITAPGADRVAADKAQTHCPRLEGLVPWWMKRRGRLRLADFR